MRVCVRACACVCVCVCECAHACMHACMCTQGRVCVHMFAGAGMRACMYFALQSAVSCLTANMLSLIQSRVARWHQIGRTTQCELTLCSCLQASDLQDVLQLRPACQSKRGNVPVLPEASRRYECLRVSLLMVQRSACLLNPWMPGWVGVAQS